MPPPPLAVPLARCACKADYGRCTGLTFDDATCADLSTQNSHCGACGNTCDAASTTGCTTGECTCKADYGRCTGLTFDDATCADLSTQNSHCGACGNTCDAASTTGCTTGECTCDTGYGRCAGLTFDDATCADLSSEVDHCGSCGNACGANSTTCASGMCQCTAGSGYDVGAGECRACAPLVGWSDGTTACDPCDADCESCDPEDGLCASSDQRVWCLEATCVACSATVSGGDPCGGEQAISLDCEQVVAGDLDGGRFRVLAKFRLLLRCDGVRQFGPWPGQLQVGATEQRRQASDEADLVYLAPDGEWVDACSSCPGVCGPMQTCREGVHLVRYRLSGDENQGNTPPSPISPIPAPTPTPVSPPGTTPIDAAWHGLSLSWIMIVVALAVAVPRFL
jgi:hypothetical protein